MNAKPERAVDQRRDDGRDQARRGVGRPDRAGGRAQGRGGAATPDRRAAQGSERIQDLGRAQGPERDPRRGRAQGAPRSPDDVAAQRSPGGADSSRSPGRGAAPARGRANGAPWPGGRATARREGAEEGFATRGTAALAPRPSEPDRAVRGAQRVPWLKVAPPMPVSVPRAPFVLLLLFVVVGGVLGILMINTKVNENAFKLKDLEQQQARLDREEQDLSQQIAEAESPNNLAVRAKQLGLVVGTPAFIRLPDGRIIGVPRPAGDESGGPGPGLQPAGR